MINKVLRLGNKNINRVSSPYLIAEIGVNHEGSIKIAEKQIILAHEGGADAVKFQTYKASKIASKKSKAYWDLNLEPTLSQFELFRKYDKFDKKDYLHLKNFSDEVGIDFVSTPFDLDAVEFLDPLVRYFKIASADITNYPLIKQIAEKSKPVLLSTGASNIDEIDSAIAILEKHGCNEIVLLHCILNYPTQKQHANLNMIDNLVEKYSDYFVGYSDHTLPDESMDSLIIAYLKGAIVLEKHFTHDKSLPGNDHYHAMDKFDLINFRSRFENIKDLLGNHEKKCLDEENTSRLNARRSLVLTKNKNKGESLSKDDLICKRPGTGISPMELDNVLGKKIKNNLYEDHILTWNDLSD